MFFTASKILAWFIQPTSWFVLLNLAALLLLWRRRYRGALWVLTGSIVLLLALKELPLGAVLIRPLEQAFPSPVLPDRIHGIIVLTGAEDLLLSHAYEKPQLNADAERYTEFVALARAYPEAKLVVSGGSGRIENEGLSEADVVRRFLFGQGMDVERVVFEGRSRNTAESAIYSRGLVQPRESESWVLVTTASHMPRAAGAFRNAGFTIIPYPVSYRAFPTFSWRDKGLETTGIAVHEWIGIAAYRLTGRM
jgi:uncharacterized SAM-binding protein YcdF (DUF218 family)